MALKIALTIPPNRVPETPDEEAIPAQVYPESYARIVHVRSMAQESFIFVCWYADETARANGELPVKVQEFPVATATLIGDIYPASYSYLKSLPEFEGAVDC